MKHIEYADLRALGASKKVLDYYSGTDPLKITQEYDGTYTLKFMSDPPIRYATGAELIADLESMAEAEE